jgi:H+-transporting ATPase
MKFLIKTFRGRQIAKRAKATGPTGVPLTRTQSRAASINQSLYSNRTTFITRATRRFGLGKKVHVSNQELKRFSSYQAAQAGTTLQRSASRPQ